MGGESYNSSSSSLDHSSRDSRMGSQRELTNIRGAQLFLIDGEESVLMTSGEFSLKLLKQTHSPLAVVVASVGEVQWPVGKDAPVLKVWSRRYTFALPGLVYGMILPDSTHLGALQHLESILAEYSTFETHHEIANAVQFATNGRRDDSGFWTAVAPEVETLSSQVARNIDSTSTIVASSIVMGGDWAALSIKHVGAAASLMKRKAAAGPDTGLTNSSSPDQPAADNTHGDGGVSPRMMKRMQQARRMSAVAKLMSRTLLKGAISAKGHVSKTLGFDMNGATSGPIYAPAEVDTARNVAVASVDAFGKVVEAVETAGKSLFDATQKVGTDIVQERFGQDAGHVLQDGFGAFGNVVNTAWTLNKMGVRMLLRMTAASAALNSRSASSRSATSPVTSLGDDQNLSTGSMQQNSMKHSRSAPQLQHEISLLPGSQSPQPGQPQSVQNLLNVSGQQNLHPAELHTSQFFPTSAEQMRNHGVRLPAGPVPSFMPARHFAGIIPPGPRGNSPFQQYRTRHLAQVQAPFSFQPRTNMRME